MAANPKKTKRDRLIMGDIEGVAVDGLILGDKVGVAVDGLKVLNFSPSKTKDSTAIHRAWELLP